ncbi:MAG: restriction endonuclease subunit S [Victivallaceae bacterium]|nr:restriction endonuclease subunit S [Victivallaceae bacterium]
MSEWNEEILDNLVFVDPEQLSLSTDEDFAFFYIDISSVSEGHIDYPVSQIKFKGSPSRARKTLKLNDVLMSTVRPNLKSFAKFNRESKFNFVASTGFAILRAKQETDINFIYHNLFSEKVERQIQTLVVGSNYPAINSSDVRKLIFDVPDYQTQRKIARILTTADAVIEKTQAAIAKYKAIEQGMLHDLFTRGIDPATNKLRPTYEDAPELYEESKLGWIPKEWEEKPLAIYSTQIGDGIHTTPKYSENTDYYFVNGNNLSEGQIEIGDTALCVSEEEYKKHFKELNKRTILYSINGTIGNIALYKNEKIILGKSACYISCKQNVNLDFIYFFLQSFPVNKFYENELTGSTIKNLSLASVRNTPITISKDDTEQELIANRIRTSTNKIQTEQIYLHKLQQIKAGLMADLLSGKKKVNVDEEPVN